MSAQNRININLLDKGGLTFSTKGRVLNWLLSTFRIIVIITELLVVVAFVSRFWLDAQNSDLNEEIDQKRAVLAASKDFETQYRETKDKLAIYAAETSNQGFWRDSLETITSNLPTDVVLQQIRFLDQQEIHIEGISPNEANIQQLVVNLKGKSIFENVSILEVETDQDDPTLTVFVLKITIKLP